MCVCVGVGGGGAATRLNASLNQHHSFQTAVCFPPTGKQGLTTMGYINTNPAATVLYKQLPIQI